MHARRCVIITEVRINKSVTRDLLPKAMELGVARQSEKGLCCGPEMFDYLNIRSRLWCAITYQDSSAEMRIRQFQRLRLRPLAHGNTAVHGYARSICFYLINKSKGQKHIYIFTETWHASVWLVLVWLVKPCLESVEIFLLHHRFVFISFVPIISVFICTYAQLVSFSLC